MTVLLITAGGAGLCGLVGMLIVWLTPEEKCTCPRSWPGSARLAICPKCARGDA